MEIYLTIVRWMTNTKTEQREGIEWLARIIPHHTNNDVRTIQFSGARLQFRLCVCRALIIIRQVPLMFRWKLHVFLYSNRAFHIRWMESCETEHLFHSVEVNRKFHFFLISFIPFAAQRFRTPASSGQPINWFPFDLSLFLTRTPILWIELLVVTIGRKINCSRTLVVGRECSDIEED